MPTVDLSRAIGGRAGIPVSTVMRARTAAVAAVVLGVVTLGLGLASVLLDSLIHQPGTGDRRPTRSSRRSAWCP